MKIKKQKKNHERTHKENIEKTKKLDKKTFLLKKRKEKILYPKKPPSLPPSSPIIIRKKKKKKDSRDNPTTIITSISHFSPLLLEKRNKNQPLAMVNQ